MQRIDSFTRPARMAERRDRMRLAPIIPSRPCRLRHVGGRRRQRKGWTKKGRRQGIEMLTGLSELAIVSILLFCHPGTRLPAFLSQGLVPIPPSSLSQAFYTLLFSFYISTPYIFVPPTRIFKPRHDHIIVCSHGHPPRKELRKGA